jgi:hypothetical protein
MIYVDDCRDRKPPRANVWADSRAELLHAAQLVGGNPDWLVDPGTGNEHIEVTFDRRGHLLKNGATRVKRYTLDSYTGEMQAVEEQRSFHFVTWWWLQQLL